MDSFETPPQKVVYERTGELIPGFAPGGLEMRYLHTCKRELWFHHHRVEIDRETQSIRRGIRTDKTAYGGTDSHVIDGTIAIDLLEDGRVIEVKPSNSMETASKMQLAYYLWYLNKRYDTLREGVLAIPNERTRKTVTLTPELTEKIESKLVQIADVVQQDSPPEFTEKPFCDTCAYQDFCFQ